MSMILLNTGLFARKDMSQSIKLISGLDVDGIEIGASFLDLLMDFRLSQESFSILRSFKYKSLHAPVNFKYRKDRFTRDVVHKIKQVHDLVDAEYVVFHPHSIEDYGLLKESSIPLALENDREVHGLDCDGMKKLVFENDTGFVLDTAHAMSFSEEEVKRLIDRLSDRIVAVHLSTRVDGRDHMPLHKSKELLHVLEPVRSLDCPFVLEVWHSFKDVISEEISFVRDWLGR